MNSSRKYFVAMALVAVIASGATFVWAHGGDPNLIHACVNNGSGLIRVIQPIENCRSGEINLDWIPNATAGNSGISMTSVLGETHAGQLQCINIFSRFAEWPCPAYIVVPVSNSGKYVSLVVQPSENNMNGPAVVALAVNGVPTGLSLTIPAGSVALQSVTGAVNVAVGDMIAVYSDGSGASSGSVFYNATYGFQSN
jgi:hypothetical protein